MTITELILLLQAQPDHNQRVIVRGYESGYNDITKLEPIKLKLNVNTEWYYGSHEGTWSDETFDEIALELSA